MMIQKKPCTRCLLSEAGYGDTARLVAEGIAGLPKKERTDETLYQKRLAACRECEHLYRGTCQKCGCYVELRAAAKNGRCPASQRKW